MTQNCKKIFTSVLLLVCLIISSSASAQTTSCPPPEDLSPKAKKLYEKATDKKKKWTSDDRVEWLIEATDIQDDYIDAWSALARQLYKKSLKNIELIGDCKVAVSTWLQLCPDAGSDSHYILGAIAYLTGDFESTITEFEIFIDQPYTGATKFIRKRREANSAIFDSKFQIQYHAHENEYVPKPLPLISLPEDEYLPALSPDGRILFFTRASRHKSKGDAISTRVETFTWARRANTSSPFDSGTPLDYPFNVGTNYGGASLSIDNRILVVSVTNPTENNPGNIDIFHTSYKVDGRDDKGEFIYYWDNLIPFGPEINTDLGWESQPSLSADGNELFFASARSNSIPDADGNPTMDIFVSIKDSLGNWSNASVLPPPISTDKHEKAPFLHPDGKTLYFSSDRSPSGGGYDIWMTQRDSLGVWSKPQNLGLPVNSFEDEHGLVVSASGEEAFFASRRQGTAGLDLLSFTVPESLRPEAIKIIHGQVDPSPPDENVRLTLEYVTSKLVEEIQLNIDDGTFATLVHTERNEDVILHVDGEGLAFEANIVYLAGEENLGNEQPDLKLRAHKSSEKDAFELKDVQFETNQTELTHATSLILEAFATYLLSHPEFKVSIEGHTDNIGSPRDNILLSRTRAEVVAQFLERSGVDTSRLESHGYGEERPKASNESLEGRAVNRRTEFIVTN